MKKNKEFTNNDEKKIRKDERRKVRRKKRAKGTIYGVIIIILILLLLLGSGYLGLNPLGIHTDGGGEYSLINTSDEAETAEETKVVRTAKESRSGQLEIIVDEGKYIYQDEIYDFEGIKAIVMDITLEDGDEKFMIIDKYAEIKAFDALQKLLDEQGYEYNIDEQYE